MARITSCRSIADCDRLAWQAPGSKHRIVALIRFSIVVRLAVVRSSRCSAAASKMSNCSSSQSAAANWNHGGPSVVPTDDIAAVEQMVEQRSGLSARIEAERRWLWFNRDAFTFNHSAELQIKAKGGKNTQAREGETIMAGVTRNLAASQPITPTDRRRA